MEGIDKSVFYYDLPKSLIAQEPLAERSASRLLVLSKETGEIKHTGFADIIDYINEGDCLVLNDTKVMPARLIGMKETGAAIEILLLKRIEGSDWEVLARPAKRFRAGDTINIGNGLLKARALRVFDEGIRHVRLEYDGIFEEILDTLGEMPLPPYITKRLADKNRYQTVYAEKIGSAAAPTAGLHFTEDIIRALEEKGVKIAKITLHVGLGTFRPVKSDNILEHKMHSEYYRVDEENAVLINSAKKSGGKIVCVGTTSVRTLETLAADGVLRAGEGETDIFIYPGYKFKITDKLITNFHLPESTLMALVCAFAGTERVMRAYKVAVSERYRFFSFGDAMLIK